MKKFILMLCSLTLIFSFNTYASNKTAVKTKRLSITVDLIYQQRNENGDFDQYQIQNIIKTTSNTMS